MKRTDVMHSLKAYRLPLAVVGLYIVAGFLAPERTVNALGAAWATFANVIPIVLAVFAALGLINVCVDKQAMAKTLGEQAGLPALLLAAAAGTILVGPIFVVFPLMKTMRDHGTSWGVITTALAAWAVKLPMIPLESGLLGWRFSLSRSVLMLVFAVLMGMIVDRVMDQWEPAVIEKVA